MCNPKNWKNSSRAKWNCSKSGWIRVLQIHCQGRPGKCVFLCDLDWQLVIETSGTKPRRAPPVYPAYRRSPNKQRLDAGVFFLPSPLFWHIDLSLGVIFLLAPTLGQDKESNVLCSDDTVNFTIFLTRMTEMTGTTEVIRETGMTRVTRVTWVTKITGTTGTTGLAWINRMTGISWMCSISGMTWSLMKEPEKDLIL